MSSAEAKSYGKSEAYPYPQPEKKSEKKFENDWSQARLVCN